MKRAVLQACFSNSFATFELAFLSFDSIEMSTQKRQEKVLNLTPLAICIIPDLKRFEVVWNVSKSHFAGTFCITMTGSSFVIQIMAADSDNVEGANDDDDPVPFHSWLFTFDCRRSIMITRSNASSKVNFWPNQPSVLGNNNKRFLQR